MKNIYRIMYIFMILGFASCNTINSRSKTIPKKNGDIVLKSSLEKINLIKEDNKVDENLLNFLKLFNIAHDNTIEGINGAMQDKFIRKAGLERRDLEDSEEDKSKRKEALILLSKMGFIEEIKSTKQNPKYFLLFGAFMFRVISRFEDFINQYNQGILQPENIVFLGALNRKLRENEIEEIKKRATEEELKTFLSVVGKEKIEDLSEADMMRFVWTTKASKELKEQFNELKKNLVFVNSSNNLLGLNNRATTAGTISTWLKLEGDQKETDIPKPIPGQCHGNVEMPYAIRMEKVLRAFLIKENSKEDKKWSFISWNSPKASDSLLLNVYKDELARAFYQELQLRKTINELKK